jgi:hypothetical protein
MKYFPVWIITVFFPFYLIAGVNNFTDNNLALKTTANSQTVTTTYEFHFNTDGDVENWKNYSSVALEAKGGKLIFSVAKIDADNNVGYQSLSLRYEQGIDASAAGYAHIVFKSETSKVESVHIRGNNKDLGTSANKTITQNTDFQTLDFHLKSSADWTGNITNFSFYINTTDSNGFSIGDKVYFEKIILDNQPFLPPEQLSYSVSKTLANQGGGNSVSPSVNWHNNSGKFSLQPQIQGVSIDSNTGIISWDSTVPNGKYMFTVTASSTTGSVSTTYSLRKGVLSPTDLNYSPDAITIEYNQTGASVIPTVEWNGDQGSFSFENKVDDALRIDPRTGEIQWNDKLVVGDHTVKIKAENQAGATVITIKITKNAPPISPPDNFGYSESTKTIFIHESGATKTPQISWNGEQGSFSMEG